MAPESACTSLELRSYQRSSYCHQCMTEFVTLLKLTLIDLWYMCGIHFSCVKGLRVCASINGALFFYE